MAENIFARKGECYKDCLSRLLQVMPGKEDDDPTEARLFENEMGQAD